MSQGPSFDISLPAGWGKQELVALLAPVEGVWVRAEGGCAQITFETEEGAREAAVLMRSLGQTVSVHRGRLAESPASPSPPSPPPPPPPLLSPGPYSSVMIPVVSTTLLVSYRHTWRLVESVHAALLDMGRAGPVHKADTILQRLELAQLQSQIEERDARIAELAERPAEQQVVREEAPPEGIQEQLASAASMIQLTQKQLREARDKSRQSELQKDDMKKRESQAKTQLQEALSRHTKELERKSQQAEELERRVSHVDALRRLEYSELYTRFDHATGEVEEWSCLSMENTQNLTRILAEEMLALSNRLQEEWHHERSEEECLAAEEKEAQDLLMCSERDASARRIVLLEEQLEKMRHSEEALQQEVETLRDRSKTLQNQLDESTNALATQSSNYGEMQRESEVVRQLAERERDIAVSIAEAAKEAAKSERDLLITEVRATLDSERAKSRVEIETSQQRASEDLHHELEEVRAQKQVEIGELNDKYTGIVQQYDRCLEEKRGSLATIEALNQRIADEAHACIALKARVADLERELAAANEAAAAATAAAERESAASLRRAPSTPEVAVLQPRTPEPRTLEVLPDKRRPDTRDGSTLTDAEPEAPNACNDAEVEQLRKELDSALAEAELWKSEASMRGDASGEVIVLEKKISVFEDREQQLKNALRQSGVEIDQMAASLHAAQATASAKSGQVDALQAQIRTSNLNLETLRAESQEHTWYRDEYTRVSQELEATNSELRRLRGEVARLERGLKVREEEADQAAHVHGIEVSKLQDALARGKDRIEKLGDEATRSRTQLQQAAVSLGEAVKAQTEESSQRQEGIRHHQEESLRVKEQLASSDAHVVQLTNHVNTLTRDLEAERARFEELEAVSIAHSGNFQRLKLQADELAHDKKTVLDELHGTRKQRDEDFAEAGLMHKRLASERDGALMQLKILHSDLVAAVRDKATAEEREDAVRGELETLAEDLQTTQARLADMTRTAEEARTADRRSQREVADLHTRCTALSEELTMRVPEPVDPAQCKQCEVYQAARRLQQEVMSGMQAEVANASADAEALRLKSSDYEAQVARLQGETASLRALLAESEAHVAKIEGRPSKEEYTRLLSRLQAAEGAAATMDADARSAVRDASRWSADLNEKEAEALSLRRHAEAVEAEARETEADLRSTIARLTSQLAGHSEAVYKAEHPEWGGESLSLFVDGSFGRGRSEGYWSMEAGEKEDDGRPLGVRLRLLWSGAAEEYLVSDTCGEEWVGDSLKLVIVDSPPDWLTAAMFRKGIEDAEARATAAQWKLQTAGTPRAASPRSNFDALPSVRRTPGASVARSAATPLSLSPRRSPSPPAKPPTPALPSLPATPPVGSKPGADPQALVQLFAAEFPKVDRTLISGVAHNVAEGTMSESQARLMLMDMAAMDSYDEM